MMTNPPPPTHDNDYNRRDRADSPELEDILESRIIPPETILPSDYPLEWPPRQTLSRVSNPPPSAPSLASPAPSSQHNSSSAWSQTRSPTSAPSNPFYTAPYRPSTPPVASSAEQSPIISPAKRFSTGEVKPLPFSPGSPQQPLTEEDRVKFTQV
jgi:hypothetical protein